MSVRWVDVGKGDAMVPNIRSCIVAREIRGPEEVAIFAPTPPLEALRTVLSLAVTQFPGNVKKSRDRNSEECMQLSMVDLSRAYFNSQINDSRPSCAALPPEHPRHGSGLGGKFLRRMCGTRRAAEWWHDVFISIDPYGGSRKAVLHCVFVIITSSTRFAQYMATISLRVVPHDI